MQACQVKQVVSFFFIQLNGVTTDIGNSKCGLTVCNAKGHPRLEPVDRLFVLNFRASLTLTSRRGARTGQMALDSVDGAPDGGLVFGLDLRKCRS